MSKTITVRISGKGPETDAPSVSDLLDQLRDYFDLLGVVEQAIAEDGQSAIVWRIINATKVNPLTFTIQAYARQYAVNVDTRADFVMAHASNGLHLLQAKAERPRYFSEKALEKAERIFERVTNGLDRTEIITDDHPPFVLTPTVARVAAKNARAVLEPPEKPYKEIGSVEGYFHGVNRDGWGRSIMHLRHRLTGDEVKCVVVGDAARDVAHCEVEEVWRARRIEVYGTIQYRGLGRIMQIEVEKIRFLRDRSELPGVQDILDPDFTGGLKSEEYLERLRDGDLS